MFDAHNCRQAFPGVVACKIRIVILQKFIFPRVIIDRPGDGRTQTGEVGAAINGLNCVRKGINQLGIGIRILHRDVYPNTIHVLFPLDDRMQDLSVSI